MKFELEALDWFQGIGFYEFGLLLYMKELNFVQNYYVQQKWRYISFHVFKGKINMYTYLTLYYRNIVEYVYEIHPT